MTARHPTVVDRLEAIQQSAVRIEGCVRLLAGAEIERIASKGNIIDALLGDVEAIAIELCWLHNAPAAVLQAAAPNDDELEGAR